MQGGGGWGPPGQGGPPQGYPPQPQGYGQQPQQQGYGPPPGGFGGPMQQMPFGPQFVAPTGMYGQVFACPRCNNPNLSKPSFTWWGGILGPKLFNHTVCSGCHFSFNGKTGKSNNAVIAIYIVVILILVLGGTIATATAH